jgi:hypothetical protein
MRGHAISHVRFGVDNIEAFLYVVPLAVLTVVTNVVIVPNVLNMVTYLHGTMHMGVSGSVTTSANFFGATSGFAMIGAFISDSYITRARTMLLFGPFMFLVICIFVFRYLHDL